MRLAEQLILKGKEQGYLSPNEILEPFPELDADPDQMERLFALFRDMGIAVTDGASEEMEPAWSPNGELLYFLSDRDGFRCIWARRLNGASKQPAGDAFAVLHFHRARRSLRRMTGTTGLIGLSVAPGRMVFSFGELTGNIWLEEKMP